MGAARSLGIQYTVIIAVAIFVVGSFILTRTVAGLRIYAIGGDARAAELCGVPVGRTVVGLYAVNGLLIGLVAVLIAGRLGSITPTIGVRFELDVLTAAILGGVAFSGGAGPAARHRHRRRHHRHPQCRPDLRRTSVLVAIDRGRQHAAARACRRPGRDRLRGRRRSAHAASRSASCASLEPRGPRDRAARTALCRTQPTPHGLFDHRRAEVVRCADRAGGRHASPSSKGEIVCLLGDNGAGKSTLVKIISGAIRPDAGSMTLDGRSVHFRSPQDARADGVETVYQDLALCPNLSVTHNMMLGREQTRRWLGFIPVRDDRRGAKEMPQRLATLGVTLSDHNLLVRSLSGGQRQSVAIARSLGEHVKLICLDEPTAALGVKQTAQVIEAHPLDRRERHRRHPRSPTTSRTVRALADRIVVLSLGRVVYDGPVAHLAPTSSGG